MSFYLDTCNNTYKNTKIDYLKLKNDRMIDQMGGSSRIKKILYKNGKIEIINMIDDDILDKRSTFPIGSITKIFTLFTILLLHQADKDQQKLLDIDDYVSKYVSTNNKNNENSFAKIKIIDIINHTSGLKSLPDNIKLIYVHHDNASQCVKTFIDEDLFINDPGTDHYSNIGYLILGHIIEKITKLTYIEAYKKYIFIPLEIHSTDIGESSIRLYAEKCNKIKKHENNFKYWALSAGGLYSNVNDLLIFAKRSLKLLNNDTMDILKNKTYIGKMNNENGAIGHSGKIYGSHTRFYFTVDPDNNNLDKIHIEFTTCVSIKKEIDKYYNSEL